MIKYFLFLSCLSLCLCLSLYAAAAKKPHHKKSKRAPGSIESYLREMYCDEMPVGTERKVYYTLNMSPTKVAAKYVLRRPKTDLYEVDIPINLEVRAGPDPKIIEAMHDKIKGCLADSDRYLRDGDGTRLKVNAIFKGEKKSLFERAIQDDIHIEGENHRENALAFSSKISCSAVMHEMMHHLGLVDEYYESRMNGEMRDDNCRVLGPEDSLMHYHEKAVASFNPEGGPALRFFKVNGEVCGKDRLGRPECRKEEDFMHLAPGVTAAEITQAAKNVMKENFGKDPSARYLEQAVTSEPAVQEQITKLNRKSVLEPAHFRAIIYPACQGRNALYYKCARLAYVTKYDKTDCNIPPECAAMDWLK